MEKLRKIRKNFLPVSYTFKKCLKKLTTQFSKSYKIHGEPKFFYLFLDQKIYLLLATVVVTDQNCMRQDCPTMLDTAKKVWQRCNSVPRFCPIVSTVVVYVPVYGGVASPLLTQDGDAAATPVIHCTHKKG